MELGICILRARFQRLTWHRQVSFTNIADVKSTSSRVVNGERCSGLIRQRIASSRYQLFSHCAKLSTHMRSNTSAFLVVQYSAKLGRMRIGYSSSLLQNAR